MLAYLSVPLITSIKPQHAVTYAPANLPQSVRLMFVTAKPGLSSHSASAALSASTVDAPVAFRVMFDAACVASTPWVRERRKAAWGRWEWRS